MSEIKIPLQVEKDIAVWCRNNYDSSETGYGTWFNPASFGYSLSLPRIQELEKEVEVSSEIIKGVGSLLAWCVVQKEENMGSVIGIEDDLFDTKATENMIWGLVINKLKSILPHPLTVFNNP